MTAVEVDIDEVVRRVLARLRSETAAPRGILVSSTDGRSNATAAAYGNESPATATSLASDLRLSDPVVSVAQVAGRLDRIRRLVVRDDAVVTPAVRDLLRQKDIELTRGDAADGRFTSAVVLGVAETSFEPAGLIGALTQHGIAVQQLARCGLVAAVDELVNAVARGGQLGVLLTAQGNAALCLANRTRGVRAVLANNVDAVRAARVGVGANFLVMDPVGRGSFELVRMIRACTQYSATCPEPLRSRLG